MTFLLGPATVALAAAYVSQSIRHHGSIVSGTARNHRRFDLNDYFGCLDFQTISLSDVVQATSAIKAVTTPFAIEVVLILVGIRHYR